MNRPTERAERQASDVERPLRKSINPGVLFALPALLAIGLFFALPVLAAALLSLTDFDIYAIATLRNLRFVGLGNYATLLHDPLFHIALRNTAYFVVLGGPLSIALSLGAALLLTSTRVRWKAFFRGAFFLPVVTTLVAVAVVWRALYHPRVGIINYLLAQLGIAPVDWLGDPHWAMPAIILMAAWKNFGFNMVIFIAGLQSISERLYEAAAVDGAGRWQQLRCVTLPMLKPTFGFVAVMTLIGYCQLFAEPYVMTRGGPSNATLSVVLLMYQNGFQWWSMGYGAAVAFVLFAIMLVLTVLSTRWRSNPAVQRTKVDVAHC